MGGRHINDHGFWAGSRSHGSVFPDGGHKIKDESSAEGVGGLSHYEDTTEKIHAQQKMGEGKVRSHPQKPLHRN